MKEHPSEVVLIEQDPAGIWMLVARETSRRGFVAGKMPVLSSHPDKDKARAHLKWVKSGQSVQTYEHV